VKLVPTTPTTKGPAGLFTGDVHFDVIARGEDASRIRVNTVRFAPGARTAWHSHSLGQTLHVIDGIGVVATRDKVIVMRPGDTVYTPPGQEHWHGALPELPYGRSNINAANDIAGSQVGSQLAPKGR